LRVDLLGATVIMGAFRKAFEVFQDVTSLGGTSRMRRWRERFQELIGIYNRLLINISDKNERLVATVARIQVQVRKSTRHLKLAQKMLDPVRQVRKVSDREATSASNSSSIVPRHTALSSKFGSVSQNAMKHLVPTAVGAGAGAATSLALWGAVQVAAHAPTGTAMATLYGAAAGNAGWAWFGGGSLAAGGGGMAAGHLVLPGIGSAIAVAVSATMSHKEANRLAGECKKLEGANSANEKSLANLSSNCKKVGDLESKLDGEAEKLWDVISSTRRKLFRFGILSHWIRLVRMWIRGNYYRQDELSLIDKLGRAVEAFLSEFKTIQAR